MAPETPCSAEEHELRGAIGAAILLAPDPSRAIREDTLSCHDSGAAAVRTAALAVSGSGGVTSQPALRLHGLTRPAGTESWACAPDGLYETPRLRPWFRLSIERRNPDDLEIEFKLKVDRALARERPRLCVGSHPDKRTTHLTHTFTFDDGVNPPLRVSTVQTWVCTKPDRYHMRTP